MLALFPLKLRTTTSQRTSSIWRKSWRNHSTIWVPSTNIPRKWNPEDSNGAQFTRPSNSGGKTQVWILLELIIQYRRAAGRRLIDNVALCVDDQVAVISTISDSFTLFRETKRQKLRTVENIDSSFGDFQRPSHSFRRQSRHRRIRKVRDYFLLGFAWNCENVCFLVALKTSQLRVCILFACVCILLW